MNNSRTSHDIGLVALNSTPKRTRQFSKKNYLADQSHQIRKIEAILELLKAARLLKEVLPIELPCQALSLNLLRISVGSVGQYIRRPQSQ